jgi:hypothetical protein
MSKWTECGLNADWCVQAWHYGTNAPNCVDGDYYVVDNEDGDFLVHQTFPSERDKEDHDQYKEVVFKARFSSKREAMAFVESKLKGETER